MKIKTYVLIVSSTFPQGHPRAGEPTDFPESIIHGGKRHTIRRNYALWKSRIDEVKAGRACLSLRTWAGQPYRSRQAEFKRFFAEDGVSVEPLRLNPAMTEALILPPDFGALQLPSAPLVEQLAKNDGLSLSDFRAWFAGSDFAEPFGIIHFTNKSYRK